MRRCLLVLVAAFVAALVAAPAQAASLTSVFAGQTMSGNPIPCTTQSDGVRVCHGTDNGGGSADLRLKAFDGSPLEVWVILPPAPRSGSDGHYPFVVQSHGWGVPPTGPDDTQFYGPTADAWAQARIRGDAACSSRLGRLMWHARFTGGRPRRMPERLHPARRRALRGPRHPVRDGPARRRRRRRPEPHRRDRRVLRRRRLARAGDAEEPDHERRRHAQPVEDPEGQGVAPGRRGARDPVERPRLLADAQRAHARLPGHRADRRPEPDRSREAVVRLGPVRARRHRGLLQRRPISRPTCPPGMRCSTRASRTTPTPRRRRSSRRSRASTPPTTCSTAPTEPPRSPRRRC